MILKEMQLLATPNHFMRMTPLEWARFWEEQSNRPILECGNGGQPLHIYNIQFNGDILRILGPLHHHRLTRPLFGSRIIMYFDVARTVARASS